MNEVNSRSRMRRVAAQKGLPAPDFSKPKLRVWWIPQVPMKAFHVEVTSLEEAVKIMDVLAEYDMFQFENRVKPDYCNAGGLQMWYDKDDIEDCPGWIDWEDEESGEQDPKEYLKNAKQSV